MEQNLIILLKAFRNLVLRKIYYAKCYKSKRQLVSDFWFEEKTYFNIRFRGAFHFMIWKLQLFKYVLIVRKLQRITVLEGHGNKALCQINKDDLSETIINECPSCKIHMMIMA